MKIGGFDLNRKVLVVAEIGNNHEGSLERAEELVALAARAGADAVKFQTIVPERLVRPSEKERLERLKKFELSYPQYERLARTARREGLLFLSTPFDLESARFLDRLVPAFKIASGDNNFRALIACVARTGKPLLVSSGFLTLPQMAALRDFVRGIWRKSRIAQELALLHCVVSYPTAPEDAHLAMIREIAGLGVVPGYSDHTLGIEAAVLSVAAGARVIEKHFTKDKRYSGFRDHALSADPADLAALVRRVREAETLLGSGAGPRSAAEKANEASARRSIAALRDLKRGAKLAAGDITWLRPGGGLAPGEEKAVVGRSLARSVAKGELIRRADLRPVSGKKPWKKS